MELLLLGIIVVLSVLSIGFIDLLQGERALTKAQRELIEAMGERLNIE
jgi:hypothetical protein